MTTDDLSIIDKKINTLINDTNDYGFETLKSKVEEILQSVELFLIDNQVDSKAVDMYLKNVITQRNHIQKQKEVQLTQQSQQDKYTFIESICQKLEFESKEELIQKLEELESKSAVELQELLNSM